MHEDDHDDPQPPIAGEGRWLDSDNTWTYFLPLLVYMGLSQVVIPPTPDPGEPPEPNALGLTFDQYPLAYAGVLAATVVTLWFCRAGWGQWPLVSGGKLRVSPLAIAVGVVGIFLWVGCSNLGLEGRFLEAVGGPDSPARGVLGLIGFVERAAFNPFERIDDPGARYAFLAVRFLGLVVAIPILEELMIRGGLMRLVISPQLSRVPFGRVTAASVAVGIAFPVLTHPEKLAALVWFSLVTWLMVRTKNYWDCVAAHAVTNLLLGLYVLWAGAWYLW